MLADLFDESSFPLPGTDDWIVPICQGFIAERLCVSWKIFAT